MIAAASMFVPAAASRNSTRLREPTRIPTRSRASGLGSISKCIIGSRVTTLSGAVNGPGTGCRSSAAPSSCAASKPNCPMKATGT
ncbi:hypothetical protein DF048_15660 [Burkholderia seminalis]|nr:hypothetical protein DF048_15660 [Burkholderia seminalis]